MATVYDGEPADGRLKIPPEIQVAAIRVAQMAIEQKNTSKILRDQSTLQSIFYAKYLGEQTIFAIARIAGCNRTTIVNLLNRGKDEIEENGHAVTPYGFFHYYFYRFKYNLELEVLEKAKKDALEEGADPKITQSFLKILISNKGSNKNPGNTYINKQINNKTINANQTININTQVNKVMDLPEIDQQKWVLNTMKQIGIKTEDVQSLMPGLNEVNEEEVETVACEVEG